MAKIRLKRLDKDTSLVDKDAYERRLETLQMKMLSIQQAYFHERRRGIVVVEGWDAAGKGGMIRRLTEKLDPRGIRVWPIGAPEPSEQGRHYLYRFWARLPEPGTLVVFDRSWYGRVLVERVEGFAPKAAWRRAYEEINEFERWLIDDGVRLVKVFLHITAAEQVRRFAERLSNPFKRWKLTEADVRNHERRKDYVAAIEDMFDRTSTKRAPWSAIPADRKWYARISALTAITDTLGRGVDLSPPPLDEKIGKDATRWLRGIAAKHDRKDNDG